MIPGLQEIDAIVSNEIDDSVLLGQASGPEPLPEIFQGLRLVYPRERIMYNRLDNRDDTQSNSPSILDPESQVLQKLLLENRFAA